MNRREFLGGAGALVLCSNVHASAQAVGQALATPVLYYTDGYHGGVRGHMPQGCWRDILNAMHIFPEWKISLDVEAASWEALEHQDPEAYLEMKEHLENGGPRPRVEMVGGTFAQPYGWAISGESNIRQLQRGIEVIRKHFPTTPIETYSVQEPCWSSCMPQILKSFGFTGASLKNASTAWGGYTQGVDAERVNWIGPDGTSILAVPRYACETLLKVYETEAVAGSPSYVEKCVAHGISRPDGMCFQDLGWPAKPRVSASYIQYVTWHEYIHDIAKLPPKDWQFTMEDILTTLPWGEKTLQRVAQQVRSAERQLIAAEKCAALAWVNCGYPWPEEELREAWDGVLWSQAHDAWITATTRSDRQAWSFQVASETLVAEQIANAAIQDAVAALSPYATSEARGSLDPQRIRVVNSLGFDREDLIEIEVATDRKTRSIHLTDASGREVPNQIVTERLYLPQTQIEALSRAAEVGQQGKEDESDGWNTVKILFRGKVPAFGFSTYRIEPHDYALPKLFKGVTATFSASDGAVLLESDLYLLRVDSKRGGAITSFYDKELEKELCLEGSDRLFNEYRGYFIAKKQWCSSTDHAARLEILEDGPMRARVRVTGEIGGCPFQTIITLVEGERRVRFDVAFHFENDTWIGDPWDMKPEDRSTERRRSQNDGRWKLQALFPVALDHPVLYKNSAYDVCRSRNADTYFQRWDEIKHNIVQNWTDLLDENRGVGFAVFSDCTTAYTFGPDHPLALVLGWGWEGGFWWGKCPLRGEQRSSYAVMPHRDKWSEALLWQENARADEPLFAQLMNGQRPSERDERSLLRIKPDRVHLSAACVKSEHLEIRLFNASDEQTECVVSLGFLPSRAELVELDGRLVRILEVTQVNHEICETLITMPRFGIRTLRFGLTTKWKEDWKHVS